MKARGILPLSGSSWLIILDANNVVWVYRNWHEPDYLFGIWRRVRRGAPDYRKLHDFVDSI